MVARAGELHDGLDANPTHPRAAPEAPRHAFRRSGIVTWQPTEEVLIVTAIEVTEPPSGSRRPRRQSATLGRRRHG